VGVAGIIMAAILAAAMANISAALNSLRRRLLSIFTSRTSRKMNRGTFG
jgi:Na+/proline symporter